MTRWESAESTRAILAILLVGGGLLLVGLAWLVRGAADAKDLAAILVGLMGSVSGYYFGARGEEKAQDEARLAEASASQVLILQREYENRLKQKTTEAAEYAAALAEYAHLLDRIVDDPDFRQKIQAILRREGDRKG